MPIDLELLLVPADKIAGMMAEAVKAIFRGAVLLSFSLTIVRQILLFQRPNPLVRLTHALLCWSSIETYQPMFKAFVQASDSMREALSPAWGTLSIWEGLFQNLYNLWKNEETSTLGLISGAFQSTLVASHASASYSFAWMSSIGVLIFTAILANILYIAGPIWIAMGVHHDRYVKQFFQTCVTVLIIFPLCPSVVMAVITYLGSAVWTNYLNAVVVVVMNIVLGIGTIFTPFIAWKLMDKDGPSALGSFAYGMAAAALTRGLSYAAVKFAATSGGAAAAAAGGSSGSSASLPMSALMGSGGGNGSSRAAAPLPPPPESPVVGEGGRGSTPLHEPQLSSDDGRGGGNVYAPYQRNPEEHARGREALRSIMQDLDRPAVGAQSKEA